MVRFALRGLPSGRYWLYIWKDIEQLLYFDRALFGKSRAQAVATQVEQDSQLSIEVTLLAPRW